MIFARSCELCTTNLLSASEFRLDIGNRCYYASCFFYATTQVQERYAEAAAGRGPAGNEERVRSLFQIQSGRGAVDRHGSSISRLQHRKRVVWHDELRRTHRDLFRGG